MSNGKKTVEDLLAEIILDANALRVLNRKWALDLNQLSTLEMIRDDLLDVVGDLRYK